MSYFDVFGLQFERLKREYEDEAAAHVVAAEKKQADCFVPVSRLH
jgi:hypothetical protein